MQSPQPRSAALAGAVSGGQTLARDPFLTDEVTAADDDLETLAKSRGAAAIALLFGLLGAFVAIVIRRYDAINAALSAACSAGLLIAAFQAYRTRRHALPGALISLNLFLVLAVTTVLNREGPSAAFHSYSLVFFAILPHLTMYFVGVRGSIAVGLATMAYFAAIFAWSALHSASAPDPDLGVRYTVANATILVAFCLGLFYTRAQTRLMAELRMAYTTLDAVRFAEQQRLREEIDLAARIQTALLPRDLRVMGLDIAAAMLPAAEVGGDYYDVLPVEGGAWLGIGDVAGHGLNAGLAMLMMQSAVSALAQKPPSPRPDRVLSALNTTLYQNIRQRMGRDEHATLTLLRYQRDGTVCFAGAHEEILMLRAAEGRCQAIATPGPWVGARPSIAGQVPQSCLTMTDGDLLVLFTDGLTEAMDSRRRQFGLERIEAEILRARAEPVEAIRDAILRAVRAFCPVLADDVALLVMRYHATDPA
jgi:serine phosphatase RsbU (regulator of sigma subunit)